MLVGLRLRGRRGRRCRRRRTRPRRRACPPSPRDAALVPCADAGIRHTSRCGLAARRVVLADREQARVLALRAGVGLQRHRVVAGDLARASARGRRSARGSRAAWSSGANGWMRAELGPRDRLHLGGRVELHRARAERDHRAVEREVAVGEPAQVAQHLVLGAVRVEHRVREELRRARAARPGSRRRRRVELVDRRRRRRTRADTARRSRRSSSRRARCRSCRRRRRAG